MGGSQWQPQTRTNYSPAPGLVAWLLASSALACLMIPALALFYGGIIGTLLIGFFATEAALVYSFSATWLIAKALHLTMGLRIPEESELQGIDLSVHSEAASYLTDEEPVGLGSWE